MRRKGRGVVRRLGLGAIALMALILASCQSVGNDGHESVSHTRSVIRPADFEARFDDVGPGVWYGYVEFEGGYEEHIYVEGRAGWEWAITNVILPTKAEIAAELSSGGVEVSRSAQLEHRLEKYGRLHEFALERVPGASAHSEGVQPQTHYSSCSPFAHADAGPDGAYGHAVSCVDEASAVAWANPGAFKTREWADEPEHPILVSALFSDPGDCVAAEGWSEAQEVGSNSDYYSC